MAKITALTSFPDYVNFKSSGKMAYADAVKTWLVELITFQTQANDVRDEVITAKDTSIQQVVLATEQVALSVDEVAKATEQVALSVDEVAKATAQAVIATDKATTATTQANEATTQANEATQKASFATTEANRATTQADNSEESASSSQSSATQSFNSAEESALSEAQSRIVLSELKASSVEITLLSDGRSYDLGFVADTFNTGFPTDLGGLN